MNFGYSCAPTRLTSLFIRMCAIGTHFDFAIACIYLESLVKMEGQAGTVANYAGGEAVGGSWTDKVMAVKTSSAGTTDDQPAGQQDNEGAADDEWVQNANTCTVLYLTILAQ